jgi:type I restriction enzyme S subunit
LKKSSAKLHPKNTVLMTSRAPIGYLAIADKPVATNQGFQSIRCNEDIADFNFIYYLLGAYKEGIALIASGATFPEVSGGKVRQYKIKLPPLPTQQKIAKILSNHDDLIENNLKRIKLLEESARLTYEEWFLRFRIDGKKLEIDPEFDLPIGWRKVKVNSLVSYYIGGGWGEESISDKFSDEAYVIRGTDIDDIPYGNLGGAPLRCHKASNLASRKLQNKDIVFEVSGGSRTEGVAKSLLMTDNLLEQFNNDVMCASFCKLVRPKEQYLGNILLLSFKYLRSTKATEVFEIKGASSIINYNWEAFIKHQDLIMPSHDVLLNFDKKVDVLVNEIYNLGHQNQLLKEARDILLPRLMTGMIDTDDMDIAV